MTLAEKLNKYKAECDVRRRQVSVRLVPDDETLFADDGETLVSPEALKFHNELGNAEVYLELHPEHGKHGGYVPRLELSGEVAYHDGTWRDL